MPRYYLDSLVGTGSGLDPFRPSAFDVAPGCAAIDLRPDATVATGRAIVASPVTLPASPRRVLLTDDPADASAALVTRLSDRLGVNLEPSQRGFRRLVMDLLLVHGDDANPNRWNRLRPAGGRYEVWLGGLLDTLPVVSGGAVVTESFNKADSATLGPDLTWTELGGNIDIVGSAAKLNAPGAFSQARAESDLSSADHYAQGNGVSVPSDSVHVYARFDSSATTAYAALLNSAARVNIFKMVSASYTALATALDGFSTSGATLRCTCNGSAISLTHNGVVPMTLTDTSITGNTRGGIGGFGNTVTIDSFQADVLAVARAFGAGALGVGTATSGERCFGSEV